MKKEKIAALLDEKHAILVNWLENHAPEKWAVGPENKWTTGQHILHLIQSTKPLVRAVSLPAFFLAWKFGKANRPSRDFAAVVARYHEKLAAAGAVVSPFSKNMAETRPEEKTKTIGELSALNQKLNRKMSRFSEADLDRLILPHPAMGKMTLREILMWNAYHLEHHHRILKDKY